MNTGDWMLDVASGSGRAATAARRETSASPADLADSWLALARTVAPTSALVELPASTGRPGFLAQVSARRVAMKCLRSRHVPSPPPPSQVLLEAQRTMLLRLRSRGELGLQAFLQAFLAVALASAFSPIIQAGVSLVHFA